jgi:cytoskeletal protein RodZ
MSSVGETLRRARLKRNLELNRIADELKISATMLKAIEEDHFEKLPGGVFARSFVRQYARFLEADENEIVTEMNRVLEPPAEAAHPGAPPAEIPLPRMPRWQAVGDHGVRWSSSVWSLAVVVGAMLACAGAYAWWQRERRPVTTASTRPPVAARTTPEPAPPSAPKTSVPAPADVPVAPAAPAEQKSTTEATAATEQARPASAPPAETNPNAPVQVELVAQEPTWVSVRADGQYSFSGTLDANQSRTVSANRNVVLKIGNAAGIDIRLNGKSIGPLGDSGTVRTIQFTSGGFHIVPREAPKPDSPAAPGTESPDPL